MTAIRRKMLWQSGSIVLLMACGDLVAHCSRLPSRRPTSQEATAAIIDRTIQLGSGSEVIEPTSLFKNGLIRQSAYPKHRTSDFSLTT